MVCDDYFNIPVNGFFSVTLTQGILGIPNQSITINNIPANLSSTNSIINGSKVTLDSLTIKLPNDIVNANLDFTAVKTFNVNANGLKGVLLTYIIGSLVFDDTPNLTSYSGSFEGFFTISGNGLANILNYLPLKSCSVLNNSFTLLLSNIKESLTNNYGDKPVDSIVCTFATDIINTIYQMADEINVLCNTQDNCKSAEVDTINSIISELAILAGRLQPAQSNGGKVSVSNVSILFNVNLFLGRLRRILRCSNVCPPEPEEDLTCCPKSCKIKDEPPLKLVKLKNFSKK